MNINEQEVDRLKAFRKDFNCESNNLVKKAASVAKLEEDDEDEFLNKYQDKLDEFDQRIEFELKNILNRNTISTKSNKRFDVNEIFNFDVQKLNLIKSKSKDSCNYKSVASKFESLEKKILNIESNYKIEKEKAVKRCENIADNLQDCLIVTDK